MKLLCCLFAISSFVVGAVVVAIPSSNGDATGAWSERQGAYVTNANGHGEPKPGAIGYDRGPAPQGGSRPASWGPEWGTGGKAYEMHPDAQGSVYPLESTGPSGKGGYIKLAPKAVNPEFRVELLKAKRVFGETRKMVSTMTYEEVLAVMKDHPDQKFLGIKNVEEARKSLMGEILTLEDSLEHLGKGDWLSVDAKHQNLKFIKEYLSTPGTISSKLMKFIRSEKAAPYLKKFPKVAELENYRMKLGKAKTAAGVAAALALGIAGSAGADSLPPMTSPRGESWSDDKDWVGGNCAPVKK